MKKKTIALCSSLLIGGTAFSQAMHQISVDGVKHVRAESPIVYKDSKDTDGNKTALNGSDALVPVAETPTVDKESQQEPEVKQDKGLVKKEDVYASDVKWESATVGWGTIKKDTNISDEKISLIVDGNKKEFNKGIGAHATSTIIYDIEKVRYNCFTSYLGVDSSKGENGSVKFKIYVDNNLVYETGVMNGNTPAKFAKVFLNGGKELKLVADANGNNSYDHAVYADAKFIDEESQYSGQQTTELDSKISELVKSSQQSSLTPEQNKTLKNYVYNRELNNKVGYIAMMNMVSNGTISKAFFDEFTKNTDALKYYTTSGNPTGGHENALKILEKIWNEDSTAKSGFNLKLAVATALEHSSQISFWLDGKQKVDPIERYKLYKNLQNDMLGDFQKLGVIELRQVVNAKITDSDILWVRSYIPEHRPDLMTQNKIGNAAHMLKYTDRNPDGVSIHSPGFYGLNPTFKKVLEYGGVCGSISYFGSMTAKSFGVPANPVGQPGHAAFYTLTTNGWQLNNNISGWLKSNGNAMGPWAKYSSGFNSNYTLLTQEAINQGTKLDESEQLRLMSHSVTDAAQANKLLDQAISVLPISYEAWVEKINLTLKDSSSRPEDFKKLKNGIVSAFIEHPMPMTDLLNRFKDKLLNAGLAYKADYILDYKKALESTKGPTRVISNDYLSKLDGQGLYLVKFSFDGDNANKLLGINSEMQYSLDGGETYKAVKEDSQKLTDDEISSITAENGIKIKINNSDIVFTLSIKKAAIPDVGIYDEGKLVYGMDNTMEYRVNNKEWIKFTSLKDMSNFNSGDTVEIRKTSVGNTRHSDIKKFTFTDAQMPAGKISPKNLSVYKYSSEQKDKNQEAKNAIDGNKSSIWHGNWTASADKERYIIVKLDNVTKINKIGYLPSQASSSNGTILDYKVSVSKDGTNFEEVKSGTWDNNKNLKYAEFNSVDAQYVKLEGIRTYGGWISMAEFEIYQSPSTDKAELEKLIKYADTIKSIEAVKATTHKEDRWNNFVAYREKARKALEDPNVTKTEATEITATLQYFIDELGIK